MKKPTVAELRQFAKEQGFAEDFTHCINLVTGERAPWPDEQLQKWIDLSWADPDPMSDPAVRETYLDWTKEEK